MVFLHETIPCARSASITDFNGSDFNAAQFCQASGDLFDPFRNIGLLFRGLPYEEVFSPRLRQWNQTLSVQSEQGGATAHILETTIGRTPVEPTANQTRKKTTGDRRFLLYRGGDPCNHIVVEFLSTCIHTPFVPRPTNGVQQKCGACSGQSRGLSDVSRSKRQKRGR